MIEKYDETLGQGGLNALRAERQASKEARAAKRAAEAAAARRLEKIKQLERTVETYQRNAVTVAAKLSRLEEELRTANARNNELSAQLLKLLTESPEYRSPGILTKVQNLITK